jgi:hypothetical protein
MDEKLQELLNELYKELGGDVNVNATPQQTTNQTQKATEQPQYTEPTDNQSEEYDYQTQLAWENWKQYGRTVFLSMKGHPRVLKYMPLIEQRAEYKLQMDLAKNQIRDSYLDYLLEAYNEVQTEIAGIMKDFLQSYQTPAYSYAGIQNTQETPVYTMKDYHNDYKKALEYSTIKGMGEIYYKDSSEKGKYGDAKLKLGESLDEFNI